MPLKKYGVLKGRPIEVRLGTSGNAHYQVKLIDDTVDYRIAINVQSAVAPSEVEYIVVENFRHPVTSRVVDLPAGFTELTRAPTSGALDYIRGNLFDRSGMRPLPFDVPGVDNDLNEKINSIMQRAMADENAMVYAFGERWGPEQNKKDKFFGFSPGNGIHDIHMNQGNVGDYVKDDGVWQDGGMLVHFPAQNTWVGIFLKFQSQAWHTDDSTGHRLVASLSGQPEDLASKHFPPAAPTHIELPDSDEPEGLVRIIAALVNSTQSPEVETVTLINTSAHAIALDGWTIADSAKIKTPLTGTLPAGASLVVTIVPPAALSNRGGVITLLEENGLKVHGVSYTREQARHPGWTIVF
ncbi:DUF2278 domain-containing protein [Pseudomonas sp. SDI]|uniref:DUF2278 family protein n=1 Tax=Pseudomonas sp. SDI TaxID=2170734 RepID=UPI000DE7B776|nr:DUF2278 family protein [Pseudomonas sp. SDI]PWB35131.1 DUF2278 domain-containing protein [Pseudomonas sp. SDI]